MEMEIDIATRLNNHIENEQYDGMLPCKDIHDNERYMKLDKGFGAVWRLQESGDTAVIRLFVKRPSLSV
jgi:hypothetical protein